MSSQPGKFPINYRVTPLRIDRRGYRYYIAPDDTLQAYLVEENKRLRAAVSTKTTKINRLTGVIAGQRSTLNMAETIVERQRKEILSVTAEKNDVCIQLEVAKQVAADHILSVELATKYIAELEKQRDEVFAITRHRQGDSKLGGKAHEWMERSSEDSGLEAALETMGLEDVSLSAKLDVPPPRLEASAPSLITPQVGRRSVRLSIKASKRFHTVPYVKN